MSNKFIVFIFGFLTILPAFTILSMEEPEEKNEKKDQNERPKKKAKLDHQDTQSKLQAFLNLPNLCKLEIFNNLSPESQSNFFKQIKEKTSFMSEMSPLISELPEEVKTEITKILSSERPISACGINKRLYLKFSELHDQKSKNLKQPLESLLIQRFVTNNRDLAVQALFRAIQNSKIEVIKSLIEAEVDVNGFHEAYNKGCKITPLLAAAIERDSEIIAMLLKAKAKPDLVPKINIMTPLFKIISDGGASIEAKEIITLQLLKAGANPNITSDNMCSSILYFILEQSNNHEYSNILKMLLDYGLNPFIDLKIFEQEEGDVTLVDKIKLHQNKEIRQIIQEHSHNKLFLNSVKERKLITIIQLTAQRNLELPNFKINAQDENDYTALMHAVSNDWYSGVLCLLDHKAEPNLLAKDGKTALSIAENMANNQEEQTEEDIITVLKAYGAKY